VGVDVLGGLGWWLGSRRSAAAEEGGPGEGEEEKRGRGGDVRHESYAYLLPLFVLIRDSPKMIPIRG